MVRVSNCNTYGFTISFIRDIVVLVGHLFLVIIDDATFSRWSQVMSVHK